MNEFGAYLVHEQLGSGGMATVHIAESRTLRKRVALKRLHPHAAAQPELVQSFIHEARLARYLHHPNIAQTFDFGKVGDVYFMAMELVPGPTLTQLVRQCRSTVGPIPLAVTLNILGQLCDALGYAHGLADENGRPLDIIHRDVSPPNVILSNTGVVKLIDFGLAKAASSSVQTQVGTIKGKFSYIAPEYLMGQLDHRCDLWSLGVVAWELLTMRKLFAASEELEVLNLVRSMPIDPPSRHARDLPPELDAIVMTALERDPERRWQSAGAMRTALGNAVREYGVELPNRRLIQWVQWAFEQRPVTDPTDPTAPVHTEERGSGLSELIHSLDSPSARSTLSDIRKRPKLPTPVVGAAMVRRRKRGQLLIWLLVILALVAAGAVWFTYYRPRS